MRNSISALYRRSFFFMLRLWIKTRNFVDEGWRTRWLGYVFVCVVFAFVIFWYFKVPPPSYSLIAMGVAAGLMALRPEMGGREKWLWTVVLFALAYVEIRAIRHDRDVHDREQAELSRQQRQHFNEIGEGIKAAVSQSNKQFQATEKHMEALISSSRDIEGFTKENLDEATGGNSYIYFDISQPEGPFEMALPGVDKASIVANAFPRFVGDFPLHNVFVAAFCPMRHVTEVDYGTMFPHEMGRPRQGIYLQFPPNLPEADLTCYLSINASNGSYSQSVHLSKRNDKWRWASRFAKYGSSGFKREFFGPGFPRNYKWQ